MQFATASVVCSATVAGTVAYAVFVADSLNPKAVLDVIWSEPLLWMIDLVALLVILSYVLDNLVAEPQQQHQQQRQAASKKSTPSSSGRRSNKNAKVESHHFDLLAKRKEELFQYCKSRYMAKHKPNES
eukprot:gb/GECG01000484.1/.p1 GENE.gb/GECG01000484.1/~~gb/GECG01000484.1/.p1  ORF type:complete len:129 (+),score=23.97 gb/GECG01000484.1/:1-387(+)